MQYSLFLVYNRITFRKNFTNHFYIRVSGVTALFIRYGCAYSRRLTYGENGRHNPVSCLRLVR